ncbi:MAG TPA: DNA replication and repair protein RecF, partial [Tenericutes bacterium]|nr:DNA replication and repair protein RecF [Mycoplasmatota bacterium]
NNLYKDIKYKNTQFGPHKDDFEFIVSDNNLKTFGSQGQQRMAILAIKLAELELIIKYKKRKPILLLDDVFSELDLNKKNNLLKYLDKDLQIIITTTDLNNIDEKILRKSKKYKIEDANYIEEVDIYGKK